MIHLLKAGTKPIQVAKKVPLLNEWGPRTPRRRNMGAPGSGKTDSAPPVLTSSASKQKVASKVLVGPNERLDL